MLLPPTKNSTATWITDELWPCLISLIVTYFKSSAVEIFAPDIDITPLVTIPHSTYYINERFEGLVRPVISDCVFFVYNTSLEDIHMWGRHDKAIVVTDDPESVLPLWVRSRLINTIVLVPGDGKIDAHTWYPYKTTNCHEPIKTEWMTSCKNGIWNESMYPSKVPKKFDGCPVHYRTHPWPPDVSRTREGIWVGREVTMMNILAHSMDLTPVYLPTNFSFFNWDMTQDSAWAQIRNGRLDFAFCTMSLIPDYFRYAESLPVYRDQPIVWMFPKPNPKDRTEGIYSGFSPLMWEAIFGISIASAIISAGFFLAEKRKWSEYHWYDFVNILVALPPTMKTSTALGVFLIVLQFYSLHMVWFYQSTLLFNLYKTPMEKAIKKVEDAVDRGLTAYLYNWMENWFDRSERIWKIMLSPGKHEFTDPPPIAKVVEKRKGFMLVTLVNTGYEMRMKYKKDLTKLVSIENYLSNSVTAYGYRDAPLTIRYTHQMLNFISSGIFQYLSEIEYGYSDQQGVEEEQGPEVLTFESLQSLFILYGLLCSIALVIFLGENITGRWWSQTKRLLCRKRIEKAEMMIRTKRNRLLRFR